MFRALLIASLALSGPASFAQSVSVPLEEIKKDSASETPAAVEKVPAVQEKKDAERIEVTGSHIKRIDSEGTSPVTTITRKEIENSGYNSVADVIRDKSMSQFGSQREMSNSGAPAGNSEVDLRGLGSSNTLVLLNGQRLPTDAVTGAVDIGLIPMAAVERIEILADGASAIYGSDALGGVVNIITRKDFSGSEIAINQSSPQLPGGRKRELSLTNGFNTRRVNMVNVVQYRDQQAIYSRDRSWSNNGVSNTGAIPSYFDNSGNSRTTLDCPPGQLKHTAQGDVCTFKYTDIQNETPDLKQFNLLSETNVELSSKVKMNVRLGGTERETRTVLAPAPGNLELPAGVAATIDHGHALPGTDGTQPLDFSYRSTTLGNRVDQTKLLSYNALVGAKVELPREWTFEPTVSHVQVQSENRGINGYALTTSVQNAIATGQCNPFDPSLPCNLDGTRYVPVRLMKSSMSNLDLKSSGQIGGGLGLAIGGSLAYQDYRDQYDDRSVNGEVLGGNGSRGGGGRSTSAAFTELSIPFGPVEFQVAGRFDHYSDFGNTANPKLGVLWHANKNTLLRASAGTGFKAPLMQDMYAAASLGYPAFLDHKACDAERAAGGPTPDCVVQQYQTTSSGNPGLREERSVSYTAGMMYEPSKDFNASLDMFMIKNKNVVGIDLEDMTRAEEKGINPADYGVIVHRDNAHFGHITSIEAPQQNLSSQEITGLDLGSSYKFSRFKLSTEHTQMFWFKEEGFPGAGLRNKLGEAGRPAWRNVTALGYRPADRHELNFVALTTASQQKTDPTMGRLRQYTQFDLVYAYNWKHVGTITAGVRNVFNQTPPLDDSDPTSMLNAAIYDTVGRQLVTGYRTTF